MNPNAREFVPKGGPVIQDLDELAPSQFTPCQFVPIQAPVPFMPPLPPQPPQPYVNPLLYSNLLKTYSNLKTSHEDLSAKYIELYDDNNRLRKDYDYLNDDNKEILSRYAVLQEKYKGLKNVKTQLSAEDSLQCSIMEELRNENKGLHESYKRLEASLKKEKKEVQRLKNELDTHAKLRETSLYTINALETSNGRLKEEIAALREEIQKVKEENEVATIQNDLVNSEMKEYKEKFEKLQGELGTHVLNFIKTIDDVSKEKDEAVNNMELYKNRYHEKNNQVRSMMEILNKAAMEFKQDHTCWQEERKALQDSIESLCYTYAEKSEESAYYKSVVDGYEHRILELQAYKGITSTLYIPPSPSLSPSSSSLPSVPLPTKPKRQIMNPEDEDDEEYHDIWS